MGFLFCVYTELKMYKVAVNVCHFNLPASVIIDILFSFAFNDYIKKSVLAKTLSIKEKLVPFFQRQNEI